MRFFTLLDSVPQLVLSWVRYPKEISTIISEFMAHFALFFSIQGDSLIFEHQWDLEKLQRLIDTERTRHFLLLREKLGIDKPLSFSYNAHNLDKSEKEACNLVAKASGEGRASPLVRPPSCGKDPYEPWDMTPRERDMANKYLKLLSYHVDR